jgi:type IV pilus assembly protein PilB
MQPASVMSTRDLQNLLVRRGLVAPDQLRDALTATRGTDGSWLERLLAFDLLDEEAMCRCVSRDLFVPCCPRDALTHVPRSVIALLPPEVAGEHRAVPVGLERDGDLRLAMMDPTDLRAVREIEFFTGHRPMREVARATDLAEALRRYYGVVTALWPRASERHAEQLPFTFTVTHELGGPPVTAGR